MVLSELVKDPLHASAERILDLVEMGELVGAKLNGVGHRSSAPASSGKRKISSAAASKASANLSQ
jgi:hypothetical protein